MAEAEALFDQMMTLDDQTHEPNLAQIEELVLKLRQRFREHVTQAMIARQAVWLSGLVPFVQVERIMRELGQIDISQSSVWRQVKR